VVDAREDERDEGGGVGGGGGGVFGEDGGVVSDACAVVLLAQLSYSYSIAYVATNSGGPSRVSY
jgi:hypothetical protein